jgi:hypothetical protein
MTLCGLAALCAGFALADNFSGRLLDASCVSQNKSVKGCDATGNTAAFLLQTGGKLYKLDSEGNAKAAEAMKSQANRSADPTTRPSATAVMAKITGSKDGDDTIKVEMIEVQ